jgi:hypothetical protein
LDTSGTEFRVVEFVLMDSRQPQSFAASFGGFCGPDYKLEMRANSCFSKASERVYSLRGLLPVQSDWPLAVGAAPARRFWRQPTVTVWRPQ